MIRKLMTLYKVLHSRDDIENYMCQEKKKDVDLLA